MIFIIWFIELLFIFWLSKKFPIYFHNYVTHANKPKINQKYLDCVEMTKRFNEHYKLQNKGGDKHE